MKISIYLLFFLMSFNITAFSGLKFQVQTVHAVSDVLLVPQQYSTIQSAINSANENDTILVAPGTYYENINFSGKSITIKSSDTAENTIIDGSQPADPNYASVVTFKSGEIEFSILDGFTITGGTGTSSLPGKIGGGVYIENAKPVIKNCIIKNNFAVRGGGIACLYDYDHQVLNTGIILNCVISNNIATSGQGGGISTHFWGNIQLDYCTLAYNMSDGGSNIAITGTITASPSVIKNTISWAGTVYTLYAPCEFNYCDIQGGWSSGVGNINADPMFCDAFSGDFRIANNSPCVGAGEYGTTIGALGTCGQEYGRFDYPLEIGTTWTYKYDYDFFHFVDWSKRNGIHIWTVIDSSIILDDTIRFTIASKNIDTVSSSYNPTPTLKIDTTYFYIDRGQNTIIVRPPSNVYPIVDNITGYFSGNDTLRIGGRLYLERFGLISLFDSNGTNTYYRQVQKLLEFNGNPVSVQEESLLSIPSGFSLSQNYPNPFNPSTTISWQSPVSGWQTLKVYDVLGNEVATLVNEYKPAGSYEVEFNPGSSIKHPASGIYFYRLQVGEYVETKKMILLK